MGDNMADALIEELRHENREFKDMFTPKATFNVSFTKNKTYFDNEDVIGTFTTNLVKPIHVLFLRARIQCCSVGEDDRGALWSESLYRKSKTLARDMDLEAGQSKFEFLFTLPENLPGSVCNLVGAATIKARIVWCVKIKIYTTFKNGKIGSFLICEEEFRKGSLFRPQPELTPHAKMACSLSTLFRKEKMLYLETSLAKNVFERGEHVIVHVRVRNHSYVDVKSICVAIYQISTLGAAMVATSERTRKVDESKSLRNCPIEKGQCVSETFVLMPRFLGSKDYRPVIVPPYLVSERKERSPRASHERDGMDEQDSSPPRPEVAEVVEEAEVEDAEEYTVTTVAMDEEPRGGSDIGEIVEGEGERERERVPGETTPSHVGHRITPSTPPTNIGSSSSDAATEALRRITEDMALRGTSVTDKPLPLRYQSNPSSAPSSPPTATRSRLYTPSRLPAPSHSRSSPTTTRSFTLSTPLNMRSQSRANSARSSDAGKLSATQMAEMASRSSRSARGSTSSMGRFSICAAEVLGLEDPIVDSDEMSNATKNNKDPGLVLLAPTLFYQDMNEVLVHTVRYLVEVKLKIKGGKKLVALLPFTLSDQPEDGHLEPEESINGQPGETAAQFNTAHFSAIPVFDSPPIYTKLGRLSLEKQDSIMPRAHLERNDSSTSQPPSYADL